MKKLSVKDLVEFRKKSDKGKKIFVENIKSNKIEIPIKGGGDYWITSLSAVSNSYRSDDLNLIDEKIDELQKKLSTTRHSITKTMYQRNISILEKYKDMDLKRLRPSGKLSFIKKSTGNPLLTIKGLQIEAKPTRIYIFGKTDEEKVGTIGFIAKKGGYTIEEVGMFCETLYRFLKHSYSKKYQLIPRYCIAVDVSGDHIIDYSEIESGSVSPILIHTLDEINKLI